jgi:ferritin-like metal-binding protein YciE
MKFFSANLHNLREVYTNELRKALDMEQQIEKALPHMISKTQDATLKNALNSHLDETKGHIRLVERLLHSTGQNEPVPCKVMTSLIHSADEMVSDCKESSVCEVSMIAAAQQIEHHEIAVYGTLRAWALYLNLPDQAASLDQILHEEKNADSVLTKVAERVSVTTESPAYAGSHAK